MSILIPDTDARFYDWMNNNPNGFVFNLKTRTMHKSNCSHIANDAGFPNGVFTEKENTKICSKSQNEIRQWKKKSQPKDKSEIKNCKTCNP